MTGLPLLIIRVATPTAHRELVVGGDTVERAAEIGRSQGESAAARWLWREAWRAIAQAPQHRLVVRAVVGNANVSALLSWNLFDDVRFAARSLLKARGVTLVVAATLGIAIGASTAIFSVVESVLLRPLPYPDDGRIVRVGATTYSGGDTRPRSPIAVAGTSSTTIARSTSSAGIG